jgi:hypothetical protein
MQCDVEAKRIAEASDEEMNLLWFGDGRITA